MFQYLVFNNLYQCLTYVLREDYPYRKSKLLLVWVESESKSCLVDLYIQVLEYML